MEERNMKKIFISLAAIAALVSCVEEKGLEPQPQQPVGNQVTIKAVAAETKTILDGTDVVWEDNDAIKMVFSGVQNTYYTELTTTLNAASSEADFTGVLSVELQSDETVKDAGYAVYPSSAVSEFGVMHEIPTAQNGNIESEGNLSYASVSYASLSEAQPAKVSFHNVYSLIRVKVAEGMTKVTFTSTSPLAGIAPFKFDASDNTLKIDEAKWDPNTYVDYTKSNTIELTAEQNGSLSSDRIYDVIIFPGDHTLTIKVEDGTTEFSRTIKPNTFEASQYYSLDLSSIFTISQSMFEASPFGGGTIEIPVLTTSENPDYEVSFDFAGEQAWLSVAEEEELAVKSLNADVVKIAVSTTENTSKDRDAILTITDKIANKTVTATISQKCVVVDLLGNYIETYTQSSQQKKGELAIVRSDDYTKGVYKLTICGAENVYADYDANKLIVHDGNKDRELSVNDDYSQITGSSFEISSKGIYSVSAYTAVRSQGEAELTVAEQALIGVYDESWTHNTAPMTSSKGMEIKASDEAAYGQLKVKFLYVNGSYFEGYATLDGTTLNVQIGGQAHSKYQTPQWQPDVVIPFSVNQDGTISLTSNDSLYGLSNYVATKNTMDDSGDENEAGASSVNDLLSTNWSETFYDGEGDNSSNVMSISLTDDSTKGQLKVKIFNTNMGSLECYANLSNDGKTLTVLSKGVDYKMVGNSISANMEMTVSEGGNKIVYESRVSTDWGMEVGSLIATKQ